MNAAADFRYAIQERLGLDPGPVVLNGEIQRFSAKASKRDDAAWYVGYDDGLPAGAFGNWRTGEQHTWSAKPETELTEVEKAQHRSHLERLTREREAERARVAEDAARKAAAVWAEASDAAEHPYLVRKGVEPHGTRQVQQSLVVPVRISGKLTSLQFIEPDGSKRFLTGGAVKGGYFAIGKPEGTVIVCEGFATGATLHQATGEAVAIAFNAGNLIHVARAIRAKLPTARIIIAADDDYATAGNPGVTKAAEAAADVQGVTAVPPFNRELGDTGTDWNDYATAYGSTSAAAAFVEVRSCAESAKSAKTPLEGAAQVPFGTIGTIGTESGSCFRPLDRSLLGTGRSEAPVFPIELLGPTWASWCQAHATSRSTPVDYVASALLAAAASCIGNARWAKITPEWSEPAALWIALVGGPSAGKSPAIDPVLRIVKDIEAAAMDEARPRVQARDEEIKRAQAANEAWEALLREAAKKATPPPPRPLDAIEPEPMSLPRMVVGDSTVEKLASILRDTPKGILITRDEIAGWIESFGRYSGGAGAERAFFLEAFGGRSFRVDRQSRSEPIIIDRLTVSILGGIQPDKLTSINSSADDGFAARFLFAWPDAISTFRVSQNVIDASRQLRAFRRLSELRPVVDEGGKPNPSFVPLAPVAHGHLETFGGQMRAAANTAHGPLAGAYGKAVVHAIRIALTIEFLSWAEYGGPEPDCVSERSALAGIALADAYYAPQARRVFREASLPPEEQAAMAVAKWLSVNHSERFNARDLRRRIGGAVRDAKAMDAACEVLIDAGVIAPDPSRPPKQTGRPAKDFVVNPELYAGGAAH